MQKRIKNKLNLSEQQISEIAENMECGMICFYNLKTGELQTVLDIDNCFGDTEVWEKELREIHKHEDDYFEFEGVTSDHSFNIMADFAENVDNRDLRKSLIHALNNQKPFRNFKWHIDNSGEYRQKWFDFKTKAYINWVKKQIEDYNLIESYE